MRSIRPRAPTASDARFAPVLRVPAFVLAALVLGLLVLFGAVWLESQRFASPRDYFPEGALEAADAMRFGRLLAEMGEPVLSPSAGGDTAFALRMLYDPSWGNPVAVRYQTAGDGALRRSVVLDDPMARPTTRQRAALVRKTEMPAADLQVLRQRLEQQGFWELPPGDDVFGKDGYLLLVEAIDGDRHQLLVRWTPHWQAAERGLHDLAGLMTDELNRDGMRVFAQETDDRSPER